MQNSKERAQELWKSQKEEAIPMSAEAICARAQRHERENTWTYRSMQFLTPLIAALAFYRLYGVVFVKNYILAATLCWLLFTFFYFIWKFLRKAPPKMIPGEPCAQYLTRTFQGKCEFAKVTRQWILYLIPAVIIAWWAGGPAFVGKGLGIKSAWITQTHAPAPLLIALGALGFAWYAMGDIQQKAGEELKRLKE